MAPVPLPWSCSLLPARGAPGHARCELLPTGSSELESRVRRSSQICSRRRLRVPSPTLRMLHRTGSLTLLVCSTLGAADRDTTIYGESPNPDLGASGFGATFGSVVGNTGFASMPAPYGQPFGVYPGAAPPVAAAQPPMAFMSSTPFLQPQPLQPPPQTLAQAMWPQQVLQPPQQQVLVQQPLQPVQPQQFQMLALGAGQLAAAPGGGFSPPGTLSQLPNMAVPVAPLPPAIVPPGIPSQMLAQSLSDSAKHDVSGIRFIAEKAQELAREEEEASRPRRRRPRKPLPSSTEEDDRELEAIENEAMEQRAREEPHRETMVADDSVPIYARTKSLSRDLTAEVGKLNGIVSGPLSRRAEEARATGIDYRDTIRTLGEGFQRFRNGAAKMRVQAFAKHKGSAHKIEDALSKAMNLERGD